MVSILLIIIIALVGVVAALLLWDKPIMLIYSQLVYCCTFRFFKCYVGLPEAIKYVLDIINIWLLVLTIVEIARKKRYFHIRYTAICIGIFCIGTFISFIYNQQSIILYIWSLRTTLRLVTFFLACIVFLTKDDIERIISIFLVLLGANTIMSAFQYFVQGLTYDFNGGLFGFESGCNGYMNIFLSMLTAYAVCMFMYKKKGAWLIIYVVSCSMVIAALSELKIYFFELVLILIIVILTQKPGWRTVVSIAVGAICLVVGMKVFLLLYPYWTDFFTIESISEYLTMDYSIGSYTLNRMSGMPYVYENIMVNWILKVFGTGAGSGDFVFGISGWVFNEYSNLHYEWFTNVMMLLECGIVGFASYTSFFVIGGVESFKRMFKYKDNKAIHSVTFICEILAVINMWYSSVLRLEINYVLAFYLAISYIYVQEKNMDIKPIKIPKLKGLVNKGR